MVEFRERGNSDVLSELWYFAFSYQEDGSHSCSFGGSDIFGLITDIGHVGRPTPERLREIVKADGRRFSEAHVC